MPLSKRTLSGRTTAARPPGARAVVAEMDQHDFLELEPVRCGPGLQIGPSVALGKLIFAAGFPCHREEEQIGQLGDVLMVSDPVVLEDVAEVPQLGDDVLGDGGYACS
jgi:hypothetical protein